MKALVTPFRASGTVSAPSSKSELHRQLIAAALADRPTDIRCSAANRDIEATVRCLSALGADITGRPGGLCVVPLRREALPDTPALDCGESGSTLRFLTPVVCALGCGAVMTGKGRLPERPMSALVRALAGHGAAFSSEMLPFTIRGQLAGGVYTLPGNVSSQYVTGLMLAAPLASGVDIRIEGALQSVGYVRMTAETLAAFGVRAEVMPDRILVPAGQRYISPGTVQTGGDWSGAAFPLCLGALGGPVRVDGLGEDSAQGDRRIVGLLREAGAAVDTGGSGVSRGHLRGLSVDVSDIPDLVPVLAALLMHAEGDSAFLNAGRLRLKESDRLATTCAMVNALGGEARVEGDSLLISGRPHCPGGTVDGAGDHRIVMAAAVGASACEGPSLILGAEAVAKSWPGFFEAMKALGGKIDVVDVR